LALALAPAVASASTIVDWGSTWEYTFCAPSGTDWRIGGTGGCTWQSGPAPFGNINAANGSGLDQDFWYQGGNVGHDGTLWTAATALGDQCDSSYNQGTPEHTACVAASPDNLWVRRTFSVAGYDLSNIGWALGVDNGFHLYLNGSPVANGIAPGFASRSEYSGTFLPLGFVPGTNYLALALNDTGIATAFDMTVTGDPTTQVAHAPEPGTLVLFSLGGLALFASRKRLF
jgi:hypothetical protein